MVARLTKERDDYRARAYALAEAEGQVKDELARLRSPAATGEAGNLAQQLINGANREGVDTYTKTLLWHASSLLDKQAEALASSRAQGVREGIKALRYQVLFNAIADATKPVPKADLHISVEKFRQSIERALATPEPQEEKHDDGRPPNQA